MDNDLNSELEAKFQDQNLANKLAISQGGESYSYSQFARKIGKVQNTLVNSSYSIKSVALTGKKNIDQVAAVLTLYKNDILYVPINSSYPTKTRNSLIAELGLSYTLTDGKLGRACEKPDSSRLKENIAFVLTTSGSSGDHKLIPISKKNVSVFVFWAAKKFLNSSDVVYSVSPLFFDLSVFDLFSTIIAGASLVLAPLNTIDPAIHMKEMIKYQATTCYLTPSLLRQLFLRCSGKTSHSGLRTLLIAGETLYAKDISNAKLLFPKCEIFNLYGPTETNVVAWARVNDITEDPVPIGQPCPYADVYLKPNQNESELYVSGESVFNGYLSDYNYDSVFLNVNGKTYYNTGDIVREKNNRFYFVGRSDRMIKHLGFRIDLTEIESALTRHEEIQGAVVVKIDKTGFSSIVAFIVSNTSIELKELRNWLKEEIPSYAIPSKIISIKSFPLLGSNKVDYSSLVNKFSNNEY